MTIRMHLRQLLLVLAIAFAVVLPGIHTATAASADEQRVMILRERKSIGLLDGTFPVQLLKIRGYSIDVRIEGEKRTLKRGESFGPASGACSVTFQKISPETRIARFLTDCP